MYYRKDQLADQLVDLRVDLEDFDGNITYAEYTTFKVADKGGSLPAIDWRIQWHGW